MPYSLSINLPRALLSLLSICLNRCLGSLIWDYTLIIIMCFWIILICDSGGVFSPILSEQPVSTVACTSPLFLMTLAVICLASRILEAVAAPFVVQGGGDLCLLLLDFRGSGICSPLFWSQVKLWFPCHFSKSFFLMPL
jgi:hypothetical protein